MRSTACEGAGDIDGFGGLMMFSAGGAGDRRGGGFRHGNVNSGRIVLKALGKVNKKTDASVFLIIGSSG